jgi:uncharacterized protein (TIGR00290 family)
VFIPSPCSNAEYEQAMAGAMRRAKEQGISGIAFGDRFLEDVRRDREEKLSGTGVERLFPLWGEDTGRLARTMVQSGVRAYITCVNPEMLDSSLAGRSFDERLLDELPDAVDPCGEHGEFHTFVHAGPMFAEPLPVRSGRIVERDGFVFADVVSSEQDESPPASSVVSWSGGKDSALALQRFARQGGDVRGLISMFSPETATSRSHGLPLELMEDQARSLGLPLRVAHASWADYEETFKGLIRSCSAEGIEAVVFGDIFLDDHRDWVERVCGEVGVAAVEPLWSLDTADLAEEVLAEGIEARICTVRLECLDRRWLGEPFDERFLLHLAQTGVDPCGEHGEYHTVVLSAPGRTARLVIDEAEVETSQEYGHWVINRWHQESLGSDGRKDS